MALVILISIVAAVCSVVALLGCLNCFFRKRNTFTNFSNTSIPSQTPSNVQHNTAFTVDIETSQTDAVAIEPLPDILPKSETIISSRPKIKCVGRGSQAAFMSLSAGQRSFPRDHLTYLNEIGSGWFGQAIESEALKIIGGSLKSQVVVKILKDDASKDEQTQFMDEVAAFRCLEHTNVMSLLGQCTETTPYLVILEHATNGNLKTYLLSHKVHIDTLIKRKVLMKFGLDAAAGIACLHRHDFVHCDISARNCLVMSDLTVKIGDYGVAESLFKEDYYDNGTELLPIRWMAPETLTQTDGLWKTQSYDKSSDMWSFGILLWEIFSMGEQPYEMYSDEAVLQGVILDHVVTPADISPRIPHKYKLSELMTRLWQEPGQRFGIEDTHQYLVQLSLEKAEPVSILLDDGSDFDQKWKDLVPNDARSYSVASEADSKIGLAGSFSSENHRPSNAQDEEVKLANDQTQDLINNAVRKVPEMDVLLDVSNEPQVQLTLEDETWQKEVSSPDFSSPLKLSEQEMMSSTPVVKGDNANVSSASDNRSVDDVNEQDDIDAKGFGFTEFVSSEPSDMLVLSESENVNKLDSMAKSENEDGSRSSGSDFTEFVSSKPEDNHESMLQKEPVVQDDAEQLLAFDDTKVNSIPKDLEGNSDNVTLSPIDSSEKTKPLSEDVPDISSPSFQENLLPAEMEASSGDKDQVLTNLNAAMPIEKIAKKDLSNNQNQNEIKSLDNQNTALSNDSLFFNLSDATSTSQTSAVEVSVSETDPFSLLDPVPSTLTKDTMQNELLMESLIETDNGSNGFNEISSHSLSDDTSNKTEKESDVSEVQPSFSSLLLDFESNTTTSNQPVETSAADLLISLSGNHPDNSLPDIPLDVMGKAGIDLKESVDCISGSMSSFEFLEDEPPSTSQKNSEGTEGLGPVIDKVGTSTHDESDDAINHQSAVDSYSPAESTPNLVFFDSSSSSSSTNSRRKREISAEELSKILLKSSNFKPTPTGADGANSYHSSHIDLTERLGNSVYMENGEKDDDCFSAFQGPLAAPSASPVDSDAEESSETSTTSESGKEYSCVSPLDTGQPPPTPPPDIDEDKQDSQPNSPSQISVSPDSELSGDYLKIISEIYLSKGLNSTRVFETPTLETIPEHQPLHLTTDFPKNPSFSDSSSMEVRYEDLFGNDSYEWDDFYGDPLVSDVNESESHVQYSHLSNPNLSDWSFSLDSDSQPSLSSVQSSTMTKTAASTSLRSVMEKRDSDEPSLHCLSDSEQKSSGHSPRSSVVTASLSKPHKLSTLTNISVLSSDKNNSFFSLSEDYEVHLGSPLHGSGSPPAFGLEDDKKYSSPTSSPSPSYPSSPSLALPTDHVITEGHLHGFGSDPVSTLNTQDPTAVTSDTTESSFDFLEINSTSSPISSTGERESASKSYEKEEDKSESEAVQTSEGDSSPSLI